MDTHGELTSDSTRSAVDSPRLGAAIGIMVAALVILIAAPRLLLGVVVGLWGLVVSKQGVEHLVAAPVLSGLVAGAVAMAAVWLVAHWLGRAQRHGGQADGHRQEGTLPA